MNLREEIEKKVEEIGERLIKFRREIHKNPELSGLEKNTAAFVAGVLDDNDIEVRRGVGGHGVVGVLRGTGGGRCFAMRADMDALPLQEKGDAEYTSCVPGVMHACGHDVHTAVLMGTAITLSSFRDKLAGDVKFIFQPSEERAATGAKNMIEEGTLEDPAPEGIVALHCFPEGESGTILHRPGIMTASSDRLIITVKGKSGHASRPHQTVDAVLVAALVINAIHHIVSRKTDPLHTSVISIGMIKGGHAPNIIADSVVLDGTVRTLDRENRKQLPKIIEDTVKGVVLSMGGDYDFDYRFGNPPVINNIEVDEMIRDSAAEILGIKNVIRMHDPLMGAEDFAYFTEKIPGALFRLGTGNKKKGINSPLHNSSFDIDEDAIKVGAKIMSWIAAKFVNQG